MGRGIRSRPRLGRASRQRAVIGSQRLCPALDSLPAGLTRRLSKAAGAQSPRTADHPTAAGMESAIEGPPEPRGPRWYLGRAGCDLRTHGPVQVPLLARERSANKLTSPRLQPRTQIQLHRHFYPRRMISPVDAQMLRLCYPSQRQKRLLGWSFPV